MDLPIEAILETATRMAKKAFRGMPDREERVNDVRSTAWELSLKAGPHATLRSLAGYAIRRVTVRRQFSELARGIETLPKDKRASRNRYRRVAFDLAGLATMRDDPAELAALRIDYPAWLASLPPWKRQVVELLAVGEQPAIIALRLDLHASQVSRLRRELAESWKAAHS